MLFYYLCAVGEGEHRKAYPQGSQSKDADVFKWVTLHSGSPAVCQREHPGRDHRWRPDEGGDEERIVRGYAVLQWDKEGFDSDIPVPKVGDTYTSRWGPSLIVERVDNEKTGAFLLLRVFAQGYKGKAHEIGIERTDVPKAVAGKV